MDSKTTVEKLKSDVLAFCKERDWEQFHNPKDLSIALSIEASELLEIFRYKSPAEVEAMGKDPAVRKELAHETADVLYHVLRLSEVLGIDLDDALREKLALSAQKYPVEKARGKNHKYTHYQ